MKKCRAESKLRLTPIRLSRTAWYYEEPKGIVVIAELRKWDAVIGTTQQLIPWSKIESSLARQKKGKGKVDDLKAK